MKTRFFLAPLLVALPATLLAAQGLIACSSDDSSTAPPDKDAGQPDVAQPDSGHDSGNDSGKDAETPDGNAPDGEVGDAGPDAKGPDCGAVENLPPVINVVNALDQSPICDPTFALADGDGGTDAGDAGDTTGAEKCGDAGPQGCPAPAADASATCTFVLTAIEGPTPTHSVTVSAPGFVSTTLTGVHGGYGACEDVPPTVATVKLTEQVDSGH